MKPETNAHIVKARQCLRKARAGLDAATIETAMAENAARDAYYAAFHAAKAIIFERTGKTHKTHIGVHRDLNLIARGEPLIDRPMRAFLKASLSV